MSDDALLAIIHKLEQTKFPDWIYVAKNYSIADLLGDLRRLEK